MGSSCPSMATQICLRAEGNKVYLEPAVWYTLLSARRWICA
jgi:hypothetical protein